MSVAPLPSKAANSAVEYPGEQVVPKPSERGTDELVIGFVGPIGSGVSTCAELLLDLLRDKFGYDEGRVLKASELIAQHASSVGVEIGDIPSARTEKLQSAGTKLRQRYGATVVSDLIIAEIASGRSPASKMSEGNQLPAESRRHVTIIDSIKHPSEVRQLSSVYRDAFWLIGVFAPPSVRESRLRTRFSQPEEVVKAMRIDEDEQESEGQKVGKTIELSDYFIRNDQNSTQSL